MIRTALSRTIRVVLLGALLAFLPAFCEAQAYLIGTVAGGGLPDTPGPALSTSLGTPGAVAADALGNFYFTADNCVFKVDTAGQLTRVAGASPAPGFSGDGGAATSARLNLSIGAGGPNSGVAVDSAGNLYIADSQNARIRKVAAATGIITTVAGNGAHGYTGDGGLATNAQLAVPTAIAVDGPGNLYIVDSYNGRIRKVAAPTGIITTVAGGGSVIPVDGSLATGVQFEANGVAVDGSGNLFIADTNNEGVTTCTDTECTTYLTQVHNRIWKVAAAAGIITTVAGGGANFEVEGVPATTAELYATGPVVVDGSGNVYFLDFYNGISLVTAGTGILTNVAASTDFPQYLVGLAMDGSRNLYFSDTGDDRIRKVTAGTGTIATVAGDSNTAYSGDGGLATNALLDGPYGVGLDGAGNLFIGEFLNNRVRKVEAATGVITTVAGNGNPGSSGDGGLATNAELAQPEGVAVDGSGNLYIADEANERVRKVAAGTGIITTVAGGGTGLGDGGPATSAYLIPSGLAVDGAGNLYIADFADNRIRKVVLATGIITTVAGSGPLGGPGGYSGDGGLATAAELSQPYGVAVDSSGNLFIADQDNERIRKVAAGTGIISTLAGNGAQASSGDGGLAKQAEINVPHALAVDAADNIYIAESDGIRKITAATGIITTLLSIPLGYGFVGVAVGSGGQVFFTGGVDFTQAAANNVVTLINDSGAPVSEITAGNITSSDHLTFNLPLGNSNGNQQVAARRTDNALRRDSARPKAALSPGGVTVGGTMQITEILARDPSAPAAANVVVGITVPPTYVITSCLADGIPCPATGSNATVTYPLLGIGQSPSVTIVADGSQGGTEQIGLNSTSDSENLAAASFSQTVSTSPGATMASSFTGPSGTIPAGQGISYTVALANNGGAVLAQDPITAVVSLDPSLLSASVQADSSTWTCTTSSATITCTDVLGLASGGQIGFSVNGIVPPGAGGRTISSSATLTFGGQTSVTQGVSTTVTGSVPPFFSNEVYVGSGVYDLQFPDGNPFGYFNYVSTSILYHYEMGFEAFVPGSAADVYLYDFASSHWLYTSSALFPYLYDFTLKTWLYYFPDSKNPGHYTTNPRYFSNLTTGKIFTM